MYWQTSRHRIELAEPRVMGIVNVTPDSFADGGRHSTMEAALRHCERLIEEGAHIVDIGGESTRPGTAPLSLAEERARVLPVLGEAVRLGIPVSLDSYKAELMREALDLGVDIINDIWALRRPGAAEAVAAHPACGVCLMHMHGNPQTMQSAPMEGDAPTQVLAFLERAAKGLVARGVAHNRIVLDPGIGFGKTVAQNYALLARQPELLAAGWPILAGWSRKSSLGAVTGLEVDNRRVPSVAAALLAVERGARIVRVHDVAETVQALAVLRAVRENAVAGS